MGVIVSRHYDEFVGSALTGYSPDNIYREAGDPDHPKFIRSPLGHLRVPTQLHLMVSKCVEDLGAYYTSAAEFTRDALHHRAVYWLENDQLTLSAQRALERSAANAEIFSALALSEYYAELHETMRKGIETAKSPQVRVTIQMQASRLADSVDDAYWSDRFRELA